MMEANDTWDHQFDVVVVGSGAGGMTAALLASDLGLDAVVIEKAALIGGTTAVSAGVIWVPANPQSAAIGYPDSFDEALTYLQHTIGEDYDAQRVGAYLETGPALVRYLEGHSEIAFQAAPLPDYYSSLPGGKDKYRALDPLPLDAHALGDEISLLRPSHPQIVVAGMTFTTAEVATVLRKDPGWLRLILRQLISQYSRLFWRIKHRRSPRLTLGNALVARCMLSLRQRSVPIWRSCALKSLVCDEQGVAGIVAQQSDRLLRIKARSGVILAAGGFGSNPELRRTYLSRSPNTERSVAPEVNHGDAIIAGKHIGAETALMDEAWWIPVYRLRDSQLTCGMFLERAFPGCIIVNRQGQRFMNDAANYDEAGRAMADAVVQGQQEQPCYYIFDARYRRNYIAGPLQAMPGCLDPLLSAEVRALIIKAPSLAALAARLDIEPAKLEATIERYNQQAARGVDDDFARGEEPYDRHYSDPRVHPNSTMAPLSEAPFYAIPIYAGDIGTKGGLVTDKNACVSNTNGDVIKGLYAVGNSAASMMGRSYPGGGVTIGPSMIFAARAVLHMTGRTLPPG